MSWSEKLHELTPEDNTISTLLVIMISNNVLEVGVILVGSFIIW